MLFMRPDIINPLKVQVELNTQSPAFASLLFLFDASTVVSELVFGPEDVGTG